MPQYPRRTQHHHRHALQARRHDPRALQALGQTALGQSTSDQSAEDPSPSGQGDGAPRRSLRRFRPSHAGASPRNRWWRGLHLKRWPRQQAIDYILANQPGDRAQARKDIDRHIVMPGQATAYRIGQMEILRLRQSTRAAMGQRFDLQGFHIVVLGEGAIPPDVLGERVGAWAANMQ